MPRDGSGNYTQPHPDVVTNTTVESLIYNGFTHDVAIDLNTPRPIVAGGTGASSAAAAMDALGGEVSKIQVTNYDSHPFRAGSFYSDPGAANAPVVGHSFTGTCYPAVVTGVSTTDMFIEARDMDDLSAPPPVYVRQKKANVWGAWMVPATGGSDPHFSGVITLNGFPVISSPVPGGATNLLDRNGLISVTTGYVNPGDNGYFGTRHTFKSRTGADTYAVIGDTNIALNVPLAAGTATCTAPALSDKSTRVPTTSWVKDAAADLLATTADFPQRSITQTTAAITDLGTHLFHPSSDATVRQVALTVGTFGTSWPLGGTLMVVNFGGTLTLSANAGISLFLAGSSLTGNRTMSGGASPSVATIMKVAGTASTADLLVWGHGIT